jgi:hypothetical protein
VVEQRAEQHALVGTQAARQRLLERTNAKDRAGGEDEEPRGTGPWGRR